MQRIYLVNSLIPPALEAGERAQLEVVRLGPLGPLLPEVKRLARTFAICAVGHPGTALILGVGPSRHEVHPRPGDVVVVVRLARRALVPGDLQVDPDDLEVLVAAVAPARLPEGDGAALLRALAPGEGAGSGGEECTTS